MTHDPSEYIKGLQQLLISDKKNVAFLFGAGTSLAKKNKDSIYVPAIDEMTQNIEKALNATESYKKALSEIRKEIKSNDRSYNIEILLSNIELKIQIIGGGTLDGLNKEGFNSLVKDLKEEIKKAVSVHDKILEDKKLEELIHSDFSEWIGRANRKHSIEIFTTNYDYLFELGLEEKNIPFYDGFTGSYKPFFNAESIEDMGFIPKQTKLWKIHGSLGWHYDSEANKICRKESESEGILIYPSTLKYSESKKQPYTALMDRLTNFLKQPDTVLITCGYSFGDEHINERILTALSNNDSGHVIALFYDIKCGDGKKEYLLTEDSVLSKLAKSTKKLSAYGCRNAVIGGQIGEWKLKREPDKEDTINIGAYFAIDSKVEITAKGERTGAEEWTGKGELNLPDFSKFVSFLQRMIIEDNSLGDSQ
ncbi:hypothetical protein BMR11_15965 [Methylococcaceae bacterium CS5]|nr:hypothetical protein BMR11_15965 [Methylococcaceae bacterium CS5]